MLTKLRSKTSYSNVVSSLALFLALGGGTAYAVNEWTGANIVDESLTQDDIRDGSLRGSDIGRSTIASSRITDESLTGADIDETRLARFNQTSVIFDNGSLPVSGTFTTEGGEVMLLVSGSAFRASAGRMSIHIVVDGEAVDALYTYTNEPFSHKAFATRFVVLGNLPAGTHSVELREFNEPACSTAAETPHDICTTTDAYDDFDVAAIETP